MDQYLEIADRFQLEGKAVSAESHGGGHINDTFLIKTQTGEKYYILQRINTSVFKNAEALMDNIILVTDFLREKIARTGGDPMRETMNVVLTRDGKTLYRNAEGCWRVYMFIDGTMTMQTCENAEQFYLSACAFGHFQKLLADFPVEKLHETIRDFHHTPKRVQALREAIREDRAGRAESVKREIEFALENASWADTVVKGMEEGRIPARVTHNDTKINNILFDQVSGKAVCVIDLDTVMPGSMLYDFGDALRMGGSTGAEDEVDLDRVWFDVESFRAFAKGYLGEMREALTEDELALLPFSVKLMTYECGIRFLTDYLNGDTYFKIHRERHNLDRARNQFKLVADIAGKEEALGGIVREACGKQDLSGSPS